MAKKSVATNLNELLKDKRPKYLELAGYDRFVDALIKKAVAADKAESAVKQLRAELDLKAAEFRRGMEDKGIFTKTIHVLGSKANISYTFKDSFKSLGIDMETQLRTQFKDLYTKLFKRTKSATVRDGKRDELIALLGDKANDFLEIDEQIETVSGFREVVFDLHQTGQMDDATRKAVDTLLGVISGKPTLSIK